MSLDYGVVDQGTFQEDQLWVTIPLIALKVGMNLSRVGHVEPSSIYLASLVIPRFKGAGCAMVNAESQFFSRTSL